MPDAGDTNVNILDNILLAASAADSPGNAASTAPSQYQQPPMPDNYGNQAAPAASTNQYSNAGLLSSIYEKEFEVIIQKLQELKVASIQERQPRSKNNKKNKNREVDNLSHAFDILIAAYYIKKDYSSFKTNVEKRNQLDALIKAQIDTITDILWAGLQLIALKKVFTDIQNNLQKLSGYTQTIMASRVETTTLSAGETYEEAVIKLIKMISPNLAQTEVTTKPEADCALESPKHEPKKDGPKKPAPTKDEESLIRAYGIEVKDTMAHIISHTNAGNETRTELRTTPKELKPQHHWKEAIEFVVNDKAKADLLQHFSSLMATSGKNLFGIDKEALVNILVQNEVINPKDVANKIIKRYQKDCNQHIYNTKDNIPSDDVIKLAIALVDEQRYRNQDGDIVIPKGIKNGPAFVEAIHLYCKHEGVNFKDKSEWATMVSARISRKQIAAFEKKLANEPVAVGYEADKREQRKIVDEALKISTQVPTDPGSATPGYQSAQSPESLQGSSRHSRHSRRSTPVSRSSGPRYSSVGSQHANNGNENNNATSTAQPTKSASVKTSDYQLFPQQSPQQGDGYLPVAIAVNPTPNNDSSNTSSRGSLRRSGDEPSSKSKYESVKEPLGSTSNDSSAEGEGEDNTSSPGSRRR